jgi:hypothetical protein
VFGARSYADGTLQLFRNSELIGEADASSLPFHALGGKLGVMLDLAQGVVFDDFGGGNILIRSNVAPVARIDAPVEGVFYAAGDTIRLRGSAVDENGTPRFRWQVDLHHNNHIHYGIFGSSQPSDYLIGEDHDDGTGVFLRANLTVSDAGLADSAFVDLFPEVNLSPSPVSIAPDGETGEEFRFWIRNLGRMLAPRSQWALVLDGAQIGHGDVIVPARDSVQVTYSDAPPTPGIHFLRITVDSLRAVRETDETDNSLTQTIAVADPWASLFEKPPMVRPFSMVAVVSWVAREPGSGVVYYGTTPDLGDSSVARRDTTAHRLLLRRLAPETRYFYALSLPDSNGDFHVGPVTSFWTLAANLPTELDVTAPFPNPSPGAVQLTVRLPAASRVRLQIFDLQGRTVWEDRDRSLPAGSWPLRWSGIGEGGDRARPGIYIARVTLGEQEFVRRISLVR